MKRIRIQKPKPRGRHEIEIFPLDPRDPDIVRAKALLRAPRHSDAPSHVVIAS
jgi:hypothetical protein